MSAPRSGIQLESLARRGFWPWQPGFWGWGWPFWAPPTAAPPFQPSTSPASTPQSTPPAASPPVNNSPAPVPSSPSPPVTSSPSPPVPSSSSPLPVNTSTPVPTPPAVPAANPNTCSEIRVRREWRSFSRQEQINYISAVKCLAVKPSKLLPGAPYRRYDDFENVHSRMRNKIHWIAPFLPWHRHFMFLYESALRDECGYQGNLPRWDWTLDSNDMTKSPVWSSDTENGFGSNGKDFAHDNANLDAGTVEDGAFANLQLYYPETHLLQRNYNLPQEFREDGRTWGSQFYDREAMAVVHKQKNFPAFAVALEGNDPARPSTGPVGPHAIIHVIIGGDISPTTYAANEPLFYLHHGNVDFHWWKWQNAKPKTRLTEYSGINIRGATAQNAKSSDRLSFLGMGQDPTVRDTLDTTAYPYCYRYE